MRAVTGEVTSSNPISLSKAAAVLSRFVVSETGARPEVAAYLKRSVTAFNELIVVHREIRSHRKISRSEEKEEESMDTERKKRKRPDAEQGEVNGEIEHQERRRKIKGELLSKPFLNSKENQPNISLLV